MDDHKPLLTVLNFSGGKQSSCLLWKVLLGEIERPDEFLVLNADPGMENSKTYEYVEDMRRRCEKAGVDFRTVKGPNLYKDLIYLKRSKKTRLDNPPYWTKDPKTGKRGRLMQGCTAIYKIAPMDREIRKVLEERFGISRVTRRPGERIVCKWIGFAYDEASRIKPSKQKYVYFDYPLIDLRMKTADVVQWFVDRGIEPPPRSVCNACFANGTDHYKDMYENRPEDWKKAVRVDRAVRDWSQIGVKDEVYVSGTLLPLAELAKRNFELEGEDKDKWSCDSGYCFT